MPSQNVPVSRPPSAQTNTRAPVPAEDLQAIIRQLKFSVSELKHEVRNHEAEIRAFEEKIHQQEIAYDHVEEKITQDVQSQRDFLRASNLHTENKIETLEQSMGNLETLVRGTINDIRQLKTQGNDTVTTLNQYQQKMNQLEQLLETQNQHIQNVEIALHSLVEMWQAKEAAWDLAIKHLSSSTSPVPSSKLATSDKLGERTYRVQPGDSLEKIAKLHQVSVQSLRQANGLAQDQDRIIVGKLLKIPNS